MGMLLYAFLASFTLAGFTFICPDVSAYTAHPTRDESENAVERASDGVGKAFDGERLLPKFYQSLRKARVPEEELDFLLLEVDGKAHVVKNKSLLSFVSGDSVKILQAKLKGKGGSPYQVNLVGFLPPERLNPVDDRGWPIDTKRYLTGKKWSVGREGRLYVIAVTEKNLLHGYAFLERHTPSLRYLDISVNGQPSVVRPGETLELQASDRFKVKQVVTNLKNDAELRYQIVEADTQAPTTKVRAKHYELILTHRNKRFSMIPVVIHSL